MNFNNNSQMRIPCAAEELRLPLRGRQRRRRVAAVNLRGRKIIAEFMLMIVIVQLAR